MMIKSGYGGGRLAGRSRLAEKKIREKKFSKRKIWQPRTRKKNGAHFLWKIQKDEKKMARAPEKSETTFKLARN